MTEPVVYRASIPNPHDHLVRLTMSFRGPVADPVVAMPCWTPGSYLMREFGRNVQEVFARCDGVPCEVAKRDRSSWVVQAPAGAAVEVDYAVYCHELSLRTPHIDGTHAFLTGTSVFMFVKGLTEGSVRVELSVPPEWIVHTTMSEVDGQPDTFEAENYDELADRFFEIGADHDHFSFDVDGINHDVVIWGRGNYDRDKLAEDMARVVTRNADLFGGLPYSCYLFSVHVTDSAGGGLEHSDCTVLAWQRHKFQDEDYQQFMQLVAHEHFHVWNVKRIRPEVLGPFDYLNEAYTRALWAMEGVTSYYDQRQVLAAGLIEPSRYLEWVCKWIDQLEAVPGRRISSVELASFDAWIKLYRPTENSANSSVSYYLMGSMAVMALDLEIRRVTAGEKSYDDVMKLLWARFLDSGEGFAEDAFKATIVEVGGEALQPWIERYIEGCGDIDWSDHLAVVGLELVWESKKAKPYLGILTQSSGDRVVVSTVLSDGPNGGRDIYPGDEIAAINGYQVKRDTFDAVKSLLPDDGEVELALFRRGRLVQSVGKVAPHRGTPKLQAIAEASDEQLARRLEWLGKELNGGTKPDDQQICKTKTIS